MILAPDRSEADYRRGGSIWSQHLQDLHRRAISIKRIAGANLVMDLPTHPPWCDSMRSPTGRVMLGAEFNEKNNCRALKLEGRLVAPLGDYGRQDANRRRSALCA